MLEWPALWENQNPVQRPCEVRGARPFMTSPKVPRSYPPTTPSRQQALGRASSVSCLVPRASSAQSQQSALATHQEGGAGAAAGLLARAWQIRAPPTSLQPPASPTPVPSPSPTAAGRRLGSVAPRRARPPSAVCSRCAEDTPACSPAPTGPTVRGSPARLLAAELSPLPLLASLPACSPR